MATAKERWEIIERHASGITSKPYGEHNGNRVYLTVDANGEDTYIGPLGAEVNYHVRLDRGHRILHGLGADVRKPFSDEELQKSLNISTTDNSWTAFVTLSRIAILEDRKKGSVLSLA